MVIQGGNNREWKYGVAVRDGDLFLVLRVNRKYEHARKGHNFYVNLPEEFNKHLPDELTFRQPWDPHSSLHASGRHHHKSSDTLIGKATCGQKVDDNFQGIQQVVSQTFPLRWILGLRIPCDRNAMDGLLEIPIEEINAAKDPQWVIVDVAQAGIVPSFNLRDVKIIGQAVFKDAAPWLFVTLLDKLN